MNDFKYDELNKKYQDLLEENRYLKAKIKELEAESNVFESHLKTFQTQELGIYGTLCCEFNYVAIYSPIIFYCPILNVKK